jgi:general secretion pathway protein I
MTPERRSASGFTLIEVLVALAIIAFGLVAVFGQLGQTASTAIRLREKTLAHWVAIDRLTELRLSGAYPSVGTSSDDLEMANLRWHYEIKVSATESPDLRRADVSVSFADHPERPVASVTGFLGRPQSAAPAQASGWPMLKAGETLPGDAPGQPDTEEKPGNPPDAKGNEPEAPSADATSDGGQASDSEGAAQ